MGSRHRRPVLSSPTSTAAASARFGRLAASSGSVALLSATPDVTRLLAPPVVPPAAVNSSRDGDEDEQAQQPPEAALLGIVSGEMLLHRVPHTSDLALLSPATPARSTSPGSGDVLAPDVDV